MLLNLRQPALVPHHPPIVRLRVRYHGAKHDDRTLFPCSSLRVLPHPLVTLISESESGERSRRLDDALQALHTMMALSPAATVVVDTEGRVRGGWNPAAEALLGWNLGDLRGKLLPGFAAPGSTLEDALDHLKRGVRFPPQPGRVPTKSGTEAEVSISAAPLRRDGHTTGGLLMLEDRSERVRLESQLRQAQKLEAVGQLAGGIAHDFNNLLTIVQTNAELLADEFGEEVRTRDHLSDIQEAVERGSALVRRLMVFSRDEPIRKETLDVAALVDRYAATLRRVLPETIQVEVVLGPDAAPIHADPGAIHQVLLNLATNARDAMPEGGRLVLQVSGGHPLDAAPSESQDGDPRDWTTISVKDTGVGMPADVKRRVFEPFYTTKSADKGTGLGLSMVYGLVTQHGGSVSLDSSPGEGTEFRLTFPAADRSTLPIPETDEVVSVPQQAIATAPATETILVVEDDPSIRKVIQRTLGTRGYAILMAADGEQALEALRQHPGEVDLVISDLIMPRMDGVTLFEKHAEVGPPVPFLFISGYGEQDPRIEALLAEGVPIVHKPWSVQGLSDAVRTVLSRVGDSKEVDAFLPPDDHAGLSATSA